MPAATVDEGGGFLFRTCDSRGSLTCKKSETVGCSDGRIAVSSNADTNGYSSVSIFRRVL